MKKQAIGILAAALVLSIGTVGTLAAGSVQGRRFTDTDGNGVCDFASTSGRYVDENQDGVCDNRAVNQSSSAQRKRGQGFTDENKDGICDYAVSGERGAGFKQGFTDENQDGVCDNQSANNGGHRNGAKGRGGHHRNRVK